MSRSEDGTSYGQGEKVAPEKEPSYRLRLGRSRHRDDVEFNELDIKVKVSYKTLLLVFVLFDVFHKVVNALSDSALVQSII